MVSPTIKRIFGACVSIAGIGLIVLGAVFPRTIKDIYWTSTDLGPMAAAVGAFLIINGLILYVEGTEKGKRVTIENDSLTILPDDCGGHLEQNADDPKE